MSDITEHPTEQPNNSQIGRAGLLLMFYAALTLMTLLLPRPFNTIALWTMTAATAFIALRRVWPELPGVRRRLMRIYESGLPGKLAVLPALALTGVAALYFSVGGQPAAYTGLQWTLGAGFAFALLVLLNPAAENVFDTPAQTTATVHTRTRWLPAITGLVFLVVLAEINGDFFDPSPLDEVSHHVQFVLLVAGIGLLAWGVGGKSNLADPDDTSKSQDPFFTRRELVLLGLIVVVAFIPRLWQLGTLSRFFIDELHFSNPVGHFNVGDPIEILLPFSSVAAFPYVYPYMQWLSMEVFGRGFFALRFVSVLFGVMNVVAVYLLARELFDRRTAFLAAAFLAVFPVHVQFSRIGLNNTADPFFGSMALFFLARGFNHKPYRRAYFAWAGAMLGLTQYFYEGGRLFFPPLVIGWLVVVALVEWVRHKQAVQWRSVASATAAFVVVALLVAAPVYYTLAGQDRVLAQRLETAGLTDTVTSTITDTQSAFQHITNRLYESLLIHVSIPESQLYYAGETGFLLGYVQPFFILGGFYLLWRFIAFRRYEGGLLVLMWIGGTWLGNVFLQESRISARYVVAFPALALMVGVGLRFAGHVLLGGRKRWMHAVLAATVIVTGALQMAYFFGPHIETYHRQFRANMGRDYHDAVYRAQDFPPDTSIYVIGERVLSTRDTTDMMRLFNPDLWVHSVYPQEFDDELLSALTRQVNRVFFVEHDDAETIRRLQAAFPNLKGPLGSDQDIPLSSQYLMFFTPPVDDAPPAYPDPAE